jgi:hypothetical protein
MGREATFGESMDRALRVEWHPVGEPAPLSLDEFQSYSLGERAFRGGVQIRLRFPNDYGASIVCHGTSLGGEEGLWELGVTRWQGDASELCYDTPVTKNVIGWLTPEEVVALVRQVQGLEPAEVPV